ncbi:serine/threonine-protein phosphatase 2A activator [Entomortierella parvispora]|uniref:Serine/threonine-protein phosphatase 2A activator n=1 Tax=Entomortierella parvispora TaxID=205924 RepID=A0A9P3HG40_9FUNG|nr:serine/threonine-protein phosphatase 2A activator [Entomortierella parvispora]
MDSPASAFEDGENAELSSTSFLTPATNPAIPSTGRHSIDFSEKAPQVMEWTSALSNQVVDIPALSSASDHAPSTPTLSSMHLDHDADLEELHKLTPTLVEVPAPDIPLLQNLSLSSGANPTYLSTKPYSVSGHYAKGLDNSSTGVPSPPSSIIAEPPSPTLSHASLKLGSNYSSTSSNPGEEHEQEMDQAMDQDEDQRSQDAISQTSERKAESVAGDHGDQNGNSSFVVPRREILTKEDLELFHGSETYADLFEFLEALNESVVGVVSTAECHQSEVVKAMLKALDLVAQVTEQYPPESGHESRFGNPAFRKFYDQVALSTPEWMESLSLPKEAIPEVSKYFVECWGNRKRIDYGTGHEASFLAWLYCFDKLGLIKKEDYKAVVINVFFRYIEVMRNLQFAYWLEPAGSHGVWGLDDYHFLPFLFGAAQLRGHKYIRPKSIHDNDIVSEFAKDYMYLSCVKFINSVKSASLRWHSPMLDDISAVKTWDKVNSGMIKMYKAEVFGKLPIMQHFLYGSLLPFKGLSDTRIMDEDEEDAGVEGHTHVHAFGQEFPTCCGMKIPSAIAAAAAANASGERVIPGVPSSGARRLPFD